MPFREDGRAVAEARIVLDDAFVFRTPPFWRREGPDIILCKFLSLFVIVKGRGIPVISSVGVLRKGKGFGGLIFCGSDGLYGRRRDCLFTFSLLETPNRKHKRAVSK